jgi:hypothetical protein
MDELTYKKIKNYLRRNISNDNKLRTTLLCLYFDNINSIPIFKKIDENSIEYNFIINKFPYYFKNVNRDKIIEIFNNDVSPRKTLRVNFDEDFEKRYNYDIESENYLKISKETYRPYYYEDWKLRASLVNKIDISKQHSFYADYIRYFIKNNKFPSFTEFITYIYNKKNVPIHKDILNVYSNISYSYSKVLSSKSLNIEEIKKRVKITTSIKMRKELQEEY